MKRFTSIIAGLACITALSVPQHAEAAMSWKWVRSVFEVKNPYRGQDVTRYPGFECKAWNAFNDCVAYSYVRGNTPDNHPGGGRPKNYYRRVSSPGFSPLNYSNCQLDDYRRGTAPRTRYQICDYGEPRAYETTGGTR